MPPRQPKVAYLVKTFPKLTETFILNEIRGLEKLGMDIEIFSLKRPSGGPIQTSVAEVKARVRYVPLHVVVGVPLHVACRVVLVHLFLLLTRPLQYLRTISFSRRNHGPLWWKFFRQAAYMSFFLRPGRFDQIHAHFANAPTSVAELEHLLSGIPYSFTAHEKDIYLTDPAELKRKIAGAACVLTCTAYNRNHLAALPLWALRSL